jgi:hypothetical protein
MTCHTHIALRMSGLFASTAVACFLLTLAGGANSAYLTTSHYSCNGTVADQGTALCPLANSSGEMPIDKLTQVCATEFYNGGVTYDHYIIKESWSGGLYQDSLVDHPTTGRATVCVTASTVLAYPNVWDYLWYKQVAVSQSSTYLQSVTEVNSL